MFNQNYDAEANNKHNESIQNGINFQKAMENFENDRGAMNKRRAKDKWQYELIRRGATEFIPIDYHTFFKWYTSIFNAQTTTDYRCRQKLMMLDVSETFFNMILRGEL